MARQIERLTALKVAKASTPGYYADGAGLYLQVAPGGSESWLFRYVLRGRQRWMGLGSARAFNLADARDRARVQRQMLSDGIDPIFDAKDSKQSMRRKLAERSTTSDQARDKFLQANSPAWKNIKHSAQWLSTLQTYARPVFGSLPVGEIDAHLVLKVLEPIWTTKNGDRKPATWAHRKDT